MKIITPQQMMILRQVTVK